MRYTQSTPSVQALPSTARQCVVPVLLATATALLTVAPSFWDALWPLAWVALLPLFLALREASPRRAFLLGWWAETLMYWWDFTGSSVPWCASVRFLCQ
jgi:apolipoprotein N-acyltransferase